MKRWYVLQVYPGYEERIKKEIQSLIARQKADDLFGQILVPSARIKPLFGADSEKGVEQQQLFPGYVLVEMEMSVQSMSIALSVPRTVRFLGGDQPVPVSTQEANRILSQIKGEIAIVNNEEQFVVGQEVEIQDGPFLGFVGVIDRIDKHNDRLVVMVSIFGRMTPVELAFNQVK